MYLQINSDFKAILWNVFKWKDKGSEILQVLKLAPLFELTFFDGRDQFKNFCYSH